MRSFTTYGVTRTFGGTTYRVEGLPSHEEALMRVHKRAFEDGNWTPPKLREKWWQFWRPREHDIIEAHFAALEALNGEDE